MSGDCLSDDTLVALVDGTANAATHDRIAAHAATCTACRETLSALARDRERSGTPPTTVDASLAAGSQIGRYVVIRRLGMGGMGVVYAARDPELDRVVAVKLLRPGLGTPEMHERLRREAQAMAKLAHPNVVGVFDVGRFAGQTFVAMELVEGGTLASWLAGRTPRETIDAFAAAGRGLAAAHAQNIVHRDFKPENVLVGADGRVRVGDFGLARTAGSDPEKTRPPVALAETTPAHLTSTGVVLGTPHYMAPEQYRGEPADARSDQFSFCVALWFALYAQRPFAGDTFDELRANVLAGVPRAPSKPAPRTVHAALLRGLHLDPRARFPTMDALLAALAPRSRRWMLPAALGAIAAIAGTVAIVAVRRGDAIDPCADTAHRLDAIWSPAQKSAVAARLRAVAPSIGAIAGDRTGALVDTYIARWLRAEGSACRAGSADLGDLRSACLDHLRRGLGELVARLAQADAETAAHAVAAARDLPPVDACEDLDALVGPERAKDPATRARAEELRGELAVVRVDLATGQVRTAAAAIAAIVGAAEQTGFAPVIAEAHEVAGELAADLGELAAARRHFEVAETRGLAGHHFVVVARALTGAIAIAAREGRFADAKALRERAQAAVDGARGDKALQLALWQTLAIAETAGDDYPAAARDLASAFAKSPDDAALVGLLRARANLAMQEEHRDAALADVERAKQLQIAALGADHPEVATTLELAAGIRLQANDYAAAARDDEAARAIFVRVYGETSPSVADAEGNLAEAVLWTGEIEGALAHYQKAVAIDGKVRAPDEPAALEHRAKLAAAYDVAGDPAKSAAELEALIPLIAKRFGTPHARLADAYADLGLARLDLGYRARTAGDEPGAKRDFIAAREAAQHARDGYRTVQADHRPVLELRTIGEADLALGETDAAIAALAGARELATEEDAGTVAWIEALLGHALVAANRDPARGRLLVLHAWSHIATDDRMEDERAHLTAWMKRDRIAPP